MAPAFASFFPSFGLRTSAFAGARCATATRVNRTYARRPTPPVALAEPLAPGALLLAENITLRIFLGGLGIVASGIVSVIFVGYFIAKNYDEVEKEFWNRDDAMERLRALEELKAEMEKENQSID